MRYALIILMFLLLSGCAGKTVYRVTTPTGVTFEAINTKDYEEFEMNVAKDSEGNYGFILKEKGVSASDPMRIMQEQYKFLLSQMFQVVK